jgi:hypothetical protein
MLAKEMNVLQRESRQRISYWEVLGRRTKKYLIGMTDPSYNQAIERKSLG